MEQYTPTRRDRFRAAFQRCQMCGKRGLTVRIRRQNTAYNDDLLNFNTMHKDCYEMSEEEWEDMWKEYYGGCL